MKIKILLLLMLSLFFAVGCDVNALFEPKDSGEQREPGGRDRRPVENPADPGTVINQLLMPLQEGKAWRYRVSYKQTSKTIVDYSVMYEGEEQWTCSLARFSDSTFVFQTHFSGDKKIINGENIQTENIQGAYSFVTAQIVKDRLKIIREEGDALCPFWGDWLSLMQDQFVVCFETGQAAVTREESGVDFSFSYTLDASRGLTHGLVSRSLEFDDTKIQYTLE